MLVYVDVVLRLTASVLANNKLLNHNPPQPTLTLKVASPAPHPVATFYAPSQATATAMSYNVKGSTHGPTLNFDIVFILVLAILLFGSFTLSAIWLKQAIKSHHRQQQTSETAIVLRPQVHRVAQLGSPLVPPPPPGPQAFVDYLHRRSRLFGSQPLAVRKSTSPLITIPWRDLLAAIYSHSTLTWLGRVPPALTARFLHALILDEVLMTDISAMSIRLSLSDFDIEIRFVPSIHTRSDSVDLTAIKVIDHHELDHAYISEAKDASEEEFSLNQQANRQGVCDPQDEGGEDVGCPADKRDAVDMTQANSPEEASRQLWISKTFLLEYAPLVDFPQPFVEKNSKQHRRITPRGRRQTQNEQGTRRGRSVRPDLHPAWRCRPVWDEDSGQPMPVVTELDLYDFSDSRRSKSCPPANRNGAEADMSPPCLIPDHWVAGRWKLDGVERAHDLDTLLEGGASDLGRVFRLHACLLRSKAMWDARMARMPSTEMPSSGSSVAPLDLHLNSL